MMWWGEGKGVVVQGRLMAWGRERNKGWACEEKRRDGSKESETGAQAQAQRGFSIGVSFRVENEPTPPARLPALPSEELKTWG